MQKQRDTAFNATFLRRRLMCLCLTQKEVLDRYNNISNIKLYKPYISQIFNGKTRPKVGTMIIILQILEVEDEDLRAVIREIYQ